MTMAAAILFYLPLLSERESEERACFQVSEPPQEACNSPAGGECKRRLYSKRDCTNQRNAPELLSVHVHVHAIGMASLG